MLWTVSSLVVAAHLYRAFGFCKVQECLVASGRGVLEEHTNCP